LGENPKSPIKKKEEKQREKRMLRILEDPGKEEKQRNRKNVGILTSWGEFSIHRERKKPYVIPNSFRDFLVEN